MASLLPLLHDLLPIFMPSKVQVARGGDLIVVEERAERPPWYQQRPPVAAELTLPQDHDVKVDDPDDSPSPGSTSGVLEPIQLLDYEKKRTSSGGSAVDEGDAVTSSPKLTGEGTSVPSQHRDGPKVLRRDAMVGVSDRMCVTVLTVQPRSASAIHHHGEQDTIIYATTPGILLTSPALDTVKALRADMKGEELPSSEEEQPRRVELGPGDFAFIPAWTEHQVVNEGLEGDLNWVLFRGGGEPTQVDLDGWGGGRIRS